MLILWMLSLSVHIQLVVATELALAGNHLNARQSIQEELCEHKLGLLILHCQSPL